ncbi:MAG: hypothetical protein ACO23D_01035 [Candidatus Nanopelagicales bacterium]
MALTLTQFFESELNLEELKTIILNEEFQIQRNKDLKLSNYEISSKALSNLTINKVLEIDLPANVSAMVSNPFEVIEIWNLAEKDKILITINIPKIQSGIFVEIYKTDTNKIQVDSEIKSKVFMMGSFVEEYVSKFWKKLIEKDLTLLINWQISQI